MQQRERKTFLLSSHVQQNNVIRHCNIDVALLRYGVGGSVGVSPDYTVTGGKENYYCDYWLIVSIFMILDRICS